MPATDRLDLTVAGTGWRGDERETQLVVLARGRDEEPGASLAAVTLLHEGRGYRFRGRVIKITGARSSESSIQTYKFVFPLPPKARHWSLEALRLSWAGREIELPAPGAAAPAGGAANGAPQTAHVVNGSPSGGARPQPAERMRVRIEQSLKQLDELERTIEEQFRRLPTGVVKRRPRGSSSTSSPGKAPPAPRPEPPRGAGERAAGVASALGQVRQKVELASQPDRPKEPPRRSSRRRGGARRRSTAAWFTDALQELAQRPDFHPEED